MEAPFEREKWKWLGEAMAWKVIARGEKYRVLKHGEALR